MLKEFTYTDYVSRDSFILRLRNIALDKTVHHYELDCYTKRLKPVTWKEIFAARTEKQNWNIYRKRMIDEEVRYGYIHVFYNNTTFFGGWWIYLNTLKGSYGINFRHECNWLLVEQIMELFPMGIIPNKLFFDEWARKVADKYPRKHKKDKRKAGILFCRMILRNGTPIQVKNLRSTISSES